MFLYIVQASSQNINRILVNFYFNGRNVAKGLLVDVCQCDNQFFFVGAINCFLATSPTKPLEFFLKVCQKARVLDWVHQV